MKFARDVLRDTEKVMALGGMLTLEGDRMRTKGGVFFYLARGRMSDETRQIIFPPRTVRNKRKEDRASAGLPPFDWPKRKEVIQPLLAKLGEVETVRITLIGRPGEIETRKELIVTTMTHNFSPPTLPRGVPDLPETPTIYTVYISARQWRKVEKEVLGSPDVKMVVEGICAFDPELETISVHALQITTRSGEPEKPAAKKATKKEKPEPPAEPVTAAPAPPDTSATSDISRKLSELNAAADLYRQKIAALEAKPAEERFGLEMTQKLLKNVEGEIAALEKQKT